MPLLLFKCILPFDVSPLSPAEHFILRRPTVRLPSNFKRPRVLITHEFSNIPYYMHLVSIGTVIASKSSSIQIKRIKLNDITLHFCLRNK